MLAIVQFPIADARQFTQQGGRLAVPDFPDPRTDGDPQFVRRFGRAMVRPLGPDCAWVDEQKFCSAARAVRFAAPARLQRVGHMRRSLRRLFSDGCAVARVEIGLTFDNRLLRRGVDAHYAPYPYPSLARLWHRRRRTDAHLCVGIASQILSTLTTVGDQALERPRHLVRQGSRLAQVYERATTGHTLSLGSQTNSGLIEAGRPLMIIDFEDVSLSQWPSGAREVDPASVRGAKVAFTNIRVAGWNVGVWFLARGSASRDDIRSLRICLLRLHAEREALDLILKQIHRQRIVYEANTPHGDILERYLNNATNMMMKDKWHGISNSAILAAFDAAELAWSAGQRELLWLRFDGARRQVWRKVEEYARRREMIRVDSAVFLSPSGDLQVDQFISGSVITGTVTNKVIASQITDSFKTFQGSSRSDQDELKQAVQSLHIEVAKLVQSMTDEKVGDADEVVNNLEALTGQVSKEKPSKGLLKAAAGGIIEGSKAVASMAGPVAKAVHAVLSAVGESGLLPPDQMFPGASS